MLQAQTSTGIVRPDFTSCCGMAIFLLALVLLLTSSATSQAETLRRALASAYALNPGLDAERARQRATDEEVSKANAGWRPKIQASGSVSHTESSSRPRSLSALSHGFHGYAISLDQQIFSGFQTTNSVQAAEATVQAGQATLTTREQETLLRAVEAYVDVVRDKKIVAYRRRNRNLLASILRATDERLRINEVTQTDRAQASGRFAASAAALSLAQANLQTSQATYKQVVGHAPSFLLDPSPHRRKIPETLQATIELAVSQSPTVLAVVFSEQAAEHTANRIRGELLPQVDVRASYGQDFSPSNTISKSDAAVVSAHLTVPLYSNGDVEARVRQARHQHASLKRLVRQARNEARARATAAWSQLVAAKSAVQSDRRRVTSNRTALSGVRLEEEAGQRTLLDVLNAHEELLLAQIRLATDRRNYVLASYNILASIGRMTAAELGISDEIHDPALHLDDVRRQWYGVEVAYGDGRHETFVAEEWYE